MTLYNSRLQQHWAQLTQDTHCGVTEQGLSILLPFPTKTPQDSLPNPTNRKHRCVKNKSSPWARWRGPAQAVPHRRRRQHAREGGSISSPPVSRSHFRARCESCLFPQGHQADFNSACCMHTARLWKCCILFSSRFWPFLN